MQETVLLYHVEGDTRDKILNILNQLEIEYKDIQEKDIHQKIGYLLDIPGYENSKDKIPEATLDHEFVFFAYMTDEQLDILLQLFKASQVPYIPLKAMLTDSNVEYRFYDLYHNVQHEYEQISGQILSKSI